MTPLAENWVNEAERMLLLQKIGLVLYPIGALALTGLAIQQLREGRRQDDVLPARPR